MRSWHAFSASGTSFFEAEREPTACRSELAQSTADTIRLSQQLDRMKALVAEFEAQDDHEADDPGKLLSKLLRELKVCQSRTSSPLVITQTAAPVVYGTSQHHDLRRMVQDQKGNPMSIITPASPQRSTLNSLHPPVWGRLKPPRKAPGHLRAPARSGISSS